VPRIESHVATATHRIAVLMGRTPGSVSIAPSDSVAEATLPDSIDIGSPRELVRRRPDVLRAEREVAAQRLLVSAAQMEYLPTLSLGAAVGYAATSLDSLGRSGTRRFFVGPTLSWPLLDLGRVRTRVNISQARSEEARARYTATVLTAIEEAETALVSYDRAHARLTILGDAVRSSTRAVELAGQRFDAGLIDLLQLLDAQRTQLQAESELAQGRTDAAIALVAVYKAIGGKR
jgi:multidrug efflux system outer membrane protein